MAFPFSSPPSHRAQRRAYTQMYDEHYGAIMAFFRRRTDSGYADELTCDVFLRAWKRFPQLESTDQARPWLYAIARNVLFEHYRHVYKDKDHLDSDASAEDSPIAGFTDMVEMELDLRRALHTLSASDQEILTLLAWEQLTPSEVAEVLGISANSARVKIHRARTRLEQAYSS